MKTANTPPANKAFILDAWKGIPTIKKPVWLMRQAGRYLPEYRALRAQAGGFLDMVYNPDFASEVTLQPLKRFDLDAAILFSDILVIPHALGQKLEFLEGEGPCLGVLDIQHLDEKNCLKNLAPVLETVSQVRSKLSKEKALIGFAGSPFTVASYMVEGRGGHDFSKVKTMDPTQLQTLIDILVRVSIDYLDAQIQAGAQAIQIFESWAGVLSGAEFDRWVIAPNACIVKALQAKHPHIPMIGFPRTNNVDDILRFSTNAGFDAISISQDVKLNWAQENLQSTLCVQGNLAPELLLAGGDAMKASATHILKTLGNGPFVFNLGHGVIKETNPDHVKTLVQLIHDYRAQA